VEFEHKQSAQVTLVINPTASCYYCPPGPQLCFDIQSVTAVGRHRFELLGEERQTVNDLSGHCAMLQWNRRGSNRRPLDRQSNSPSSNTIETYRPTL